MQHNQPIKCIFVTSAVKSVVSILHTILFKSVIQIFILKIMIVNNVMNNANV